MRSRFQKDMSRAAQRNLSMTLRKMLSEHEQSKKGELHPSDTIRQRAVVPPPAFHEVLNTSAGKKAPGKSKNQVGAGTVRSARSLNTAWSKRWMIGNGITGFRRGQPELPHLTMHLDVADVFA